jgi:hypothetical protein
MSMAYSLRMSPEIHADSLESPVQQDRLSQPVVTMDDEVRAWLNQLWVQEKQRRESEDLTPWAGLD